MRLRSPRLTLRRFETERQRASMARHFSDPELSRHLLVSYDAETGLAGNAERFQRNFAASWQRCGFGGVLVHERGAVEPLGFVALKPDGEGAEPARFEIYFGLARGAWGRGYATEAVNAFVAEVRRRLEPAALRASVNAFQSPAACRVLEKCGFARDGEVALADYASPALARGSLALELWRIAAPDAPLEVVEQAAFRIGQLAPAAQRAPAELAAEIGSRLAARAERVAAERALDAGTRASRYAVYVHRA